MIKCRQLLGNQEDFFVPGVFRELPTKRVLATEFIEGKPVDKCMEENQMFLLRFMQIDPHWLNFFFGKHPETSEPRFTLLDFGGFRSYSSLFVDRCMHVIRAAYDKDEEKMLKYSRNLGFLTGYESRVIEKAHCGYFTATSILGETLASDVPCGFSQKIVTKRIHKLIPVMLEHRLTSLHDEIYPLHRNLAISRSHLISNGRIADALAQAGHEVVLVEPEYLPLASTMETAKYAERMIIQNFSGAYLHGISQFSTKAFEEVHMLSSIEKLSVFHDVCTVSCQEFLDKTDVIEKLRSFKFDMYFGEQITLCGTALAHHLGIKTHMWVSSCALMDHMSWILGVPTPLSYVPTIGELDITDRPSYFDRVRNIAEFLSNAYVYRYGSREITRIFRERYGDDFPDADDIAKRSPIVFVAADELVDFPRPILHNLVYIGGLGMSHEAKILQEPLKSEMEKGKKGVVFFSLGSNVKTHILPVEVREYMLQAVAAFPEYHFIVKHEDQDTVIPEKAKQLKNVYVTTWAPQTDILAHNRLKAFITHGGYNSLMEAALAGVPLVSIPFFFDQVRNAHVAERNGWGAVCSKYSLLKGPEKLIETLRKVLDHPEYKENAIRTQKLVRSKPFSAEERLVRYTNFVADNDGRLPELQIAGQDLSLLVYFNLDIIIPLVLTAAVLLVSFIYITYRVVTSCLSRRSTKVKKS
ncbi:hypothetical protein QR680_002797 [Steinernema hermaphroditum]|uniref:glucuronosyltransferase n=1 Tax=Steinernema hermaphroditum TaxID=289476 RepID=A0AA39H444_9BILA|nr:hypothetical protein QR680_002797 [Steinernema hermaphroditum]